MKKLRIAAIATALPLVLCAACGAADQSLGLSANWYSNTNNTNLAGTSETAEYTVTFEPEKENADFTAEYTDGVYKTTLRDENISSAEGNPLGYHFHTELTVKGRFILKGERGEEFTDTVVSDVWFLSVAEGLRPVRSEKRSDCHVPVAGASSVSASSLHYTYSYTTTYTADLSSATVLFTQTVPEEKSSETVLKLKGRTSYLDNEQILFAIRGLNLQTAFTFRSVNPVQLLPATVQGAAGEGEERKETFSVNGVSEERTVSVAKTSISYTGTYRGGSQVLYYAQRTSPTANAYRNILIRAEVPALESLGTYVYSLKSVTFNEK